MEEVRLENLTRLETTIVLLSYNRIGMTTNLVERGLKLKYHKALSVLNKIVEKGYLYKHPGHPYWKSSVWLPRYGKDRFLEMLVDYSITIHFAGSPDNMLALMVRRGLIDSSHLATAMAYADDLRGKSHDPSTSDLP